MSRIKNLQGKNWIGTLFQEPNSIFFIEIGASKYTNHYFVAIAKCGDEGCLITRQPVDETDVKLDLVRQLKERGLNPERIEWKESDDFILLKGINWDAPPLTNPELN